MELVKETNTLTKAPLRLLVAASGTGGHLFPAIATAGQLNDCQIEWLGVPDRMETQLVPSLYPLHTIAVEGFQQRFGLGRSAYFGRTRRLDPSGAEVAQSGKIFRECLLLAVTSQHGQFWRPALWVCGDYSHESNAIPGKVTRLFSPFCTAVAIGFEAAAEHLPRAKTVVAGTPVRSQFLARQPLNLPIPDSVPVIVVMGGSQGAVAVNQLVRQCAPAWLDAGAWVVHLTGNNDPDAESLKHEQYLSMPFYDNVASLLQRANLAISRSGASALTELAVTGVPSILIPFPHAADDHQRFNAEVFAGAGPPSYSVKAN